MVEQNAKTAKNFEKFIKEQLEKDRAEVLVRQSEAEGRAQELDDRIAATEELVNSKGNETEEFKALISSIEMKIGKDKAEMSTSLEEMNQSVEEGIKELKGLVESSQKKTNNNLG